MIALSALHMVFAGLYIDRLIITTNGGNGVIVLIVSHVYGYHNINDTTTIADLYNRVVALNAQVSTDNTSIADSKAQATNDAKDIAELYNHIDALNCKLSAKNASIAVLQTQLQGSVFAEWLPLATPLTLQRYIHIIVRQQGFSPPSGSVQ